MSRLTNVKNDLINRDVVKQPYRSNKPYSEQMLRSTEKAIQDVTVKPESELVRPYVTNAESDGYEQMEYEQLSPPSLSPLPPQSTPDLDWAVLPIGTAVIEFTIPTPIFSPVAGTYTSAQTIIITTIPADALIYYTTDGTEPTVNKTKYTTPIALSADTTLKAKAFKSGWIASQTKTGVYAITVGGWTAYFDNTYWYVTQGIFPPFLWSGTWDGAKWVSVDQTGIGGNHQIGISELGVWVSGLRPSLLRVTHSGTNVRAYLSYTTGYDVVDPYTSGADFTIVNASNADISALTLSTASGSFNCTNIEFFT